MRYSWASNLRKATSIHAQESQARPYRPRRMSSRQAPRAQCGIAPKTGLQQRSSMRFAGAG
eukprot:5313239-Alexandrium_andersonii.AAC.1